MNTRMIFLLVFAALLAMGAAASSANKAADPAVSERIVELPAVSVNPSPQDAAYFRAHRIVDLPRITVRPDPADLGWWLADNTARIFHLPVAMPQTSVLDSQVPVVFSYSLAAE